MKLHSLVSLGLIEARKTTRAVTWEHCENYGTAIEETNFTLNCNGYGQCTAQCDDGLINIGQKKLKCKFKKKGNNFGVLQK